MLQLAKCYLIMVVKSWGKAISGPVLVVLSLLFTALQLGTEGDDRAAMALKAAAWGTLIAAGIMVFTAQYEVWKEEYQQRASAEDLLNAKADVRGKVLAKILLFNPAKDPSGVGSGLVYTLDCANHGKARCELRALRLILTGTDFSEPYFRDQPLPQATFIDPGQGWSVDGETFYIPNVEQNALRRSVVSFRLVDSLGIEYSKIDVKVNQPPIMPVNTDIWK